MKYYIYSSELHKYLEQELQKDARAKKQKKKSHLFELWKLGY